VKNIIIRIRTEMSKEMKQEEADRRMVEAKRGTEMTLDMKALLTLAEKHREEIRKESEDEQDYYTRKSLVYYNFIFMYSLLLTCNFTLLLPETD
jgi:hypothetical protein